MTKEERMKMTEKEKIERENKNYEKFQNKIKRLTVFAHDKRMFSRMEYQMAKRKEALKNKKNEKKS